MRFKLRLFSKKRLPSKVTIKSETLLDDLNNELLLEIFDYLSFDDILLSFGNINTRLNHLIEKYPHSVDLELHSKVPEHIRSLKITRTYQLPLFFSLQSSSFASLRAIILGNLRSHDVLNILSHIPSRQLEYIYLGVCSIERSENVKKKLASIQTQILALSEYRLKQCHLREKFSVLIDDLPQTLFALEYLNIVACQDLYLLSELLSRTPNLKYIHVSTMAVSEKSFVSSRSRLTHLSLRLHQKCSVEELTTFLSTCCPYIRKLNVQLYTNGRDSCNLLGNKQQWMSIFPCQLRYFHWKAIPNSSLHFFKTKIDHSEIPRREKLCLVGSGTHERYCEVIIDPPFVSAWTRT